MFKELKIGTKLALLLGFLIIATLASGGYGVVALRNARDANLQSLRLAADLVTVVDSARSAEVAFKIQIQEFKNVLLRGHEQQDYDRYLAAFKKRSEQVAQEFGEVQEVFTRLGLPTATVEEARRMHGAIAAAYLDGLKAFEMGRADSSQKVDAVVRGKDRPLEEKIGAIVDLVQKFAAKESARLAEAAAAQSERAVALLATFVALMVAAAAIIGTFVIRALLRDLGGEPAYAREVASRIAEGDLTLDVQVREGDRSSMLVAMKTMNQNLRSVVGEVAGGAHAVADSSAQIAQGNVDLSQRTEEQASTLEETASQMEELTSTVTQNAENARQASQLAVGASDVARRGGEVVGHVVSTMTGISESSKKISDIIGVIDGIAFQTNILALNAAVEAARAGEQGRGFAVVATEVRNLAQRSASAAKEIKALIGDSVHKVDAGTKLVDDAGRTMNEIVSSVKKVSDLIAEIAAASQEQSAGIEQVNSAVTQMDQVVQQNATLVEEATAATESMKIQAAALLAMMARFRLGDRAPSAFRSVAAAPARPAKIPAPIRVKARDAAVLSG